MSKISDDNIGTSPQDAYNGLVDALSHGSKNFSNLVEIEILPTGYPLPSGCNVLVHENCIGVPKLHLIQAFAVARQMFLKHQDLRNSTAVILLINPEHLTAANARKRLIQACQARSGTELHAALAEELMFTDSMLTSQLHRHTKSPTLWGHRRWLVELGKSRDTLETTMRGCICGGSYRHSVAD
ncbi:hypothetical protein B7494_g4771 [Chlorociboria aeruginascens]|nr:hypothetical protein B7494_g4771 [Chlorociboria aeruginascens]